MFQWRRGAAGILHASQSGSERRRAGAEHGVFARRREEVDENPGNPLLRGEGKDFRDPQVFWHKPSNAWIMLVTAGRRLEFYRSIDLKWWQLASAFGENRVPGLVYECPSIFPLRDENGAGVWVLFSSFLSLENFRGKFSGCFTSYFAGDFDGYCFTPSGAGATPRRIDFGTDNYATIPYADAPDGRAVTVGWMNHWGYFWHMPEQLTLPRDVSWSHGQLVQSPAREIAAVAPRVALKADGGCEAPAGAWMLDIPANQNVWKIEAMQENQRIFSLAWDARRRIFSMHREAIHLPKSLAAEARLVDAFVLPCESTPIAKPIGAARLVVDARSVEAFCDDGRVVFTLVIFPGNQPWRVKLVQA
jgi:fructan beta-fructosidase